ncbi:MAG: hypothetical protein KDB60_07580 [Propionibacteriaceae bacterium]|nr:hypothetical protein [Propionibacteriaceae bacterium]
MNLLSIRRAFRWHRRTFAALFVAVAVLAGLNALTARAGPGIPVVIATRTIPGGATVTADDLALVQAPAEFVADGAFAAIDAVVGSTTVVDVPARATLTASALLGGEGQVAAGHVALPVRFGEASAVALLRVGSRIDVLGPTTGGSEFGVVAADVRVVAIPTAGDGGLLGGGEPALVLLEVNSTQAAQISAAASVSSVSFALH